MRTRCVGWVCAMLLLAMAGSVLAGISANMVRFGADERIRQEYFDNVPVKSDPPGLARGGLNDYLRFRTRIWGEFDPMKDVTLRVRGQRSALLVRARQEPGPPDLELGMAG